MSSGRSVLSISSRSVYGVAPYLSARAWVRAGVRPQTATSSVSSRREKMRAWCSPQPPAPTTATLMRHRPA